MLQRIFTREPPMSDQNDRFHNPKPGDREAYTPRLPEGSVPPRQPEYRPAPLRRDPEVEAMMVSANTLLALRDQVATLEATNTALIAERETWRARAEAYTTLHSESERNLAKYKSFSTELITQLNTVSVILVDVITKARQAAIDFDERVPSGHGSQPDPVINESHLQEEMPHAGQ